MTTGQRTSLLQHLRRLISGGPAGDAADGALLTAFQDAHDEAAFAALVRRHGPLVLGVCRRVLHDAHDAEDAFQAVFLVLARRAGAIRRPEALSSWLHGVAFKVAARVRQRRLRQGATMTPTDRADRAAADAASAASQRELRGILDEELSRLPDKFRLPMVLCYLEGKSNEEAARQLGWTKGTVSGQLARARDVLRVRLARRGLALSTAALATAITASAAPAALPAGLAEATARCAGQFVTNQVMTGTAAIVAQETLRAMTMTKTLTTATAMLVLAVTLAGTTALTYRLLAPAQAVPLPEKPAPEQPAPAPAMDAERAKQVAVVLRVKLLKSGPSEKYGWDEVAILHVLKNTTGQQFGKTLSVAHINVKAGVPSGDSTIYLVPYTVDTDPQNNVGGHWKLLAGGAPEGVSHGKEK